MTTTHDVPMPETVAHKVYTSFGPIYQSERVEGSDLPADKLCKLEAAIAYADARCAKLQEKIEILQGALEFNRIRAADRDALAEKVKALQDDARRYRWLRDEASWVLTADDQGCKIACYLHGVTPAAIGPGNDDFDAAIDAAGEQP